MKSKIRFILLSVYICNVCGFNLPGPLVYVVTPSSRPRTDGSMSRSAPFYYHNWMRRMDSPVNETTTTTTTARAKTQDLIFAEFETDNGSQMRKSIRKLLEKEKILPKQSTTSIPHEETTARPSEQKPESDMTDYFALYNNLYNTGEHAPVYLPSTTDSTTKLTTTQATTTPAPTTSHDPMKVENIWHIIDSEKYGHYSDKWEEIPVESEDDKRKENPVLIAGDNPIAIDDNNDSGLNENFALPGFSTTPGNVAENESRAIRTEPNVRFPYVNLKPFVMKPSKSVQQNSFYNNKKINNMFSLNDFKNNNQPVRGEAQDVPIQEPIDRYNPAQPHLPEYGSKSKQSSSNSPGKTFSNLVPPPLPPIPKVTGDDFPTPNNYEPFPPYAPSGQGPPITPPQSKPVSVYEPPQPPITHDSDSDDLPPNDGQPMDLGYRYKPPAQTFLPTVAPISKPFSGYSYNKPPSMTEVHSDMDDMTNFQGYHYNKPVMKPPPTPEYPPTDHDDSPADNGPAPPESYGHHDHHHSYGPQSDYPELIFDKPHGGKGSDSMKGSDMGMVPPPPDAKPDSMPPMDDSGFPSDFMGDFKYHHDFDHDHYHYEHHHPTTTTETPRVNRFSYYYLGKKLYYLPLYFSVYFIVYVGALIIKAVLRHKIVYPNSWRPNDQTSSFFSKRSIDSLHFTDDQMNNITRRVTRAIASAAEKYLTKKQELNEIN